MIALQNIHFGAGTDLGDADQFLIAKILQQLRELNQDEVVFISNLNHVVIAETDNVIAEQFLASSSDILFSASAQYHYDDEVLRYYFWKYYPRGKGKLHYLDSNAMIGRVEAFVRFFESIQKEYPAHFTWHDLITRFYVDYLLGASSLALILKIDRSQRVFANVTNRNSAIRWPFFSWIHEELFVRKESEFLVPKGNQVSQLNFWDWRLLKGVWKNKKSGKEPLIWVASGDMIQTMAVMSCIKTGQKTGAKSSAFVDSFRAYLISFGQFLFALLINRFETRPWRLFRYAPNKSPEWKKVMEKFLDYLEQKKGFTFAHFNDGELTFIKKYLDGNHAETWFGRRQQKYNKALGERLTKAIKMERDGYHVGVPCSTHHPKLRKLADELVGENSGVVPAMSLHHNIRFFPNIINHMKDRPCYFVKNEHQKLDIFEKLGVDIKEENQIIVPFKNSYLLYDELIDRKFPDGAIVILICGMLAKIIIPEWFERNPNTTFIALGSSMDDFIQRTNTKFRLFPKEGMPLTGNIQPTKFFAFGWKRQCKECWQMENEFENL